MEQIVARLLQLQHLPVARQEFSERVHTHPDYPSLLAVADVLDSFGVNQSVAQVADEQLAEVGFPYLAYLERGSGELVLIRSAAELAVARAEPAQWSGILLRVEGMRTPPSEEQLAAYRQERTVTRLARWSGTALSLGLLAVSAYLPSWWTTALYLLALAGVVIGYLLIGREVGATPGLIAEFCGGDAQPGCDSVLEADPVHLFGLYGLPDAVATYFPWQAGLLIAVALAGQPAAGAALLLAGLALAGPVVILASIYYQVVVVKAWCRLCLVVDGILGLQAVVALLAFSQQQVTLRALSLPTQLFAGGGLLVLTGGLLALKQVLLRQQATRQEKRALLRTKNSVPLFTTLLQQQSRADDWEFNQEMVFGAADAPIDIIMVSNPYCVPCQRTHAQLDRLLALFPELIKVRLRLTGSNADVGRFPTTTQYVLQHWLTHVRGQEDECLRTAEMLRAWYHTMNLDSFAATHPADFTGDYSSSTHLLTRHYAWNRQQGITRTPTLFVNGYLLPPGYAAEQLVLLLPGLAEYFLTQEQIQQPVFAEAATYSKQ
ncbi:vitamin K epoxide reductase family protein [Hymenobacter rigui]|uniref:Vitamin K epoxide reductase family protein n=1 Tax=Hymenobacter rigui TaxID=334424 RepID=A0A3R9UZ41_9BACT|nr:vitamin K epoxide reductase family protein [Hymenobacter rigui]RSK43177.1 vitamin K epoxide reductase family protein [Hymenobacter rigui]